MEASLLRIGRISPARPSRGPIFCSRSLNGGDKDAALRRLSRCEINTCDSLSRESAACAGSAREEVGADVITPGPLPTALQPDTFHAASRFVLPTLTTATGGFVVGWLSHKRFYARL
jgi:hypothetical protein